MEQTEKTNGFDPIQSPDVKSEIYEQLNRLLGSPYFRNSKRYPLLLRHVVEKTLQGQTEELKERSIGYEVFQKSADYDTNNDNVVRITAGEIRKRLALYYQEAGHESELRIDLPSGAYVPVFHWNSGDKEPSHDQPPQPPPEPPVLKSAFLEKPPEKIGPETPSPTVATPARRRIKWWWWSVPALLGLACLLAFIIPRTAAKPADALNAFWSPVLSAQGSMLFCVPIMHIDPKILRGEGIREEDRLGVISLTQYDEMMNRVSLADAIALTRVAAIAQAKGKPYMVKGDKFATLTDLRAGPVVLIGAFDNDWTIRLTGQLRYTFEKNLTTGMLHVRDRQNMGFDDWKLDSRTGYTKVTDDYAIIARFQDKTTEQLIVVAAGLGQYGTLAAGEVLSNPKYLQAVLAQAPKDWAGVNFEAVLTTQVISGNNGPPHPLAVRFW